MGRNRNRRSLLIPEARAALDHLKQEVLRDKAVTPTPSVQGVATKLGIPYQKQDNGEMKARDAGKIGGQIGGSMVQRLVEIAEQQLEKDGLSSDPRK